eukprot:CAMPEP_0197663990 /NCGR_PEP_ID=MMETSP1338-20131121/58361_1 /TAXON_ID=43686 ORGANISM="Pelagodinium beii, Strain RCC1491" /NCGR_SAMPLE_ID=MMETSP1338 /ASSEMBLY_ACC=CAM_ASM_000754 /LENGTH=334 /DNA_ID=CAMNT_0043242537 /DNA_START=61 /DNA_END=1065 /DNA_ORIENTATION=-
MAPGEASYGGLDDIQVLGTWNFTLQADTPLYWLRCGRLEKYLLKFKINYPCPCTCGIVLHAEADFGGTDGTSFWIERRVDADGVATKRYLLSGEGLESRPIVTRQYSDNGKDNEDEVEVLMQGYTGCIMVQNRKVQLKFRTKHDKGSIAFYNSTVSDGKDDIHFSGVRITAMRRGPMEIGGTLGKRERGMIGLDSVAQEMSTAAEDEDFVGAHGDDIGASPEASEMANASRTTPSGQAKSGQASQQASTWSSGKGGGRQSRSQHGSSSVLQRSASEGIMRRTSGMRGSRTSGKGGRWVAIATNAPASEKQLIKDSMPPKKITDNSCQDFISMPL